MHYFRFRIKKGNGELNTELNPSYYGLNISQIRKTVSEGDYEMPEYALPTSTSSSSCPTAA